MLVIEINRVVKRFQFELPDEKASELEALMKDTNIATTKELINNAITLLFWSVKEVKRGRVIASVDESDGRYKEVLIPAIARAARTGRSEPVLVQK